VIYPDSGALSATFVGVREGIDARIGALNAAGGVHGRKIVYHLQDDHADPQANSSAAFDLINRNHVFGIIESSYAAAGSADILTKAGIPVTGIAATADWATHRNMFSFLYTATAATDTSGMFARARGGTKTAVLHTALTDGGASTADRFGQSMQAAGIPVVADIAFTGGVDAPATVAARIAASGADTLASLIEPSAFVQILGALRDIGRTPKVVLSASGYNQQLLHTYGAGMAGMAIAIPYRPFESGGPAIEAYLDAMSRYAPQTQARLDTAMLSYISADMFVHGLELAGACPTREGFIKAMHAESNYDAGGLIPTLNIRDEFAKPTTCNSYVRVNPEGTAFTVAEPHLCGRVVAN
jgi:ABC-type branched-subunit amino acid transport system substrate-binding protein